MRILWLSNPPWAGSGYGEQTGIFAERLRDAGHDLACAANWGLHGVTLDWAGLTVFPTDSDWGNRSLATFAEIHRADVVIALCDAWVLRPDDWLDEQRIALWTPIDHYPIPPPVLAVLGSEKVQPIAMSRFGEEAMTAFGLDPIYVPHGIDCELFRPQPEIRDEARAAIGVPADAFLVGMVAANKGNPAVPRKGFDQAFQAMGRFMRARDDVWFYVHAEASANPKNGGGIALDVLSNAVGIPGDRIRFPGRNAWHIGIPRETVAALYQAFDVVLMPSLGEGFGIPLVEAQACGCPVITSAHSAMIELGQAAGWLVDGQPRWDALQSSFLFDPFVASIIDALEDAYATAPDEARRARAAAFALGYDADRVTRDYWAPALDLLVPPKESRQVRRARERREAKAVAR